MRLFGDSKSTSIMLHFYEGTMKFLLHFLAGVLLCPLQEYGLHPILLDGEKWGESPALSGRTRP